MHYKASHRNSNGTIAEPIFLPKGQKVRKRGAVKKVLNKKHPGVERLSDAFWV